MKKVASILVMALAFCAGAQVAAPAGTNSPTIITIAPTEAAQHTNEIVIVTGKVAQVTVRPAVIVLSFDKPYPNSPFTAVVFSRVTNKFGNLPGLEGKEVKVKGKIKLYRGKPEIIMDATNQLTVIGPGATPTATEQK